jgi:hypothetical protein
MFPIIDFTKYLQSTMISANLRIFLALLQSFLSIRCVQPLAETFVGL